MISEITGKVDDDERQPPSPPDLEGFLQKLKHKSRPLLGAWNKRWFQIDHERRALVYFRKKADASIRSNEPDDPCQPGIQTSSMSQLSCGIEKWQIEVEGSAYRSYKEFCPESGLKGHIMLADIMGIESFDDLSFQLETRSRTFHLKADSKIEKHGWASALQEFCSQQKEYDRWLAVHQAVASALGPPGARKAAGGGGGGGGMRLVDHSGAGRGSSSDEGPGRGGRGPGGGGAYEEKGQERSGGGGGGSGPYDSRSGGFGVRRGVEGEYGGSGGGYAREGRGEDYYGGSYEEERGGSRGDGGRRDYGEGEDGRGGYGDGGGRRRGYGEEEGGRGGYGDGVGWRSGGGEGREGYGDEGRGGGGGDGGYGERGGFRDDEAYDGGRRDSGYGDEGVRGEYYVQSGGRGGGGYAAARDHDGYGERVGSYRK